MNILKKCLFIFFIMLSLFGFHCDCFSIYAADNVGITYIEAKYSDIVPTNGDKFVLTYKREGGSKTARIELDASTISIKAGAIELPESNYEIVDIMYSGTNKEITNQGYGITSKFVSKKNQDSFIYISIGEKQCASLVKEYNNVIMVDQKHNKDGSLKEEVYRTDEYIDTDNEREKNTTVDNNTSTTNVTNTENGNDSQLTPSTPNQEPSVEHYKENKEQKTSQKINIIVRLFPLIIVFIVAFIAVVILHKRGKI